MIIDLLSGRSQQHWRKIWKIQLMENAFVKVLNFHFYSQLSFFLIAIATTAGNPKDQPLCPGLELKRVNLNM